MLSTPTTLITSTPWRVTPQPALIAVADIPSYMSSKTVTSSRKLAATSLAPCPSPTFSLLALGPPALPHSSTAPRPLSAPSHLSCHPVPFLLLSPMICPRKPFFSPLLCLDCHA